jgi:4-hydroxybenzoate polyprenyltransferase
VLPVFTYPFMKRITWWPQAMLGICFGWGALMGWAAVFGRLDPAPLVLYAACILWIIGYDTIYAHQDKEDDALVGVHSTARLFGPRTKPFVAGFYAGTVALLGLSLSLAAVGWPAWIGLALFAGHLAWQVQALRPDDADNCLRLFRANRDAGAILFAGLVVAAAIS